jgi:hypothetical protein
MSSVTREGLDDLEHFPERRDQGARQVRELGLEGEHL